MLWLVIRAKGCVANPPRHFLNDRSLLIVMRARCLRHTVFGNRKLGVLVCQLVACTIYGGR
jgi:hypothetical protein